MRRRHNISWMAKSFASTLKAGKIDSIYYGSATKYVPLIPSGSKILAICKYTDPFRILVSILSQLSAMDFKGLCFHFTLSFSMKNMSHTINLCAYILFTYLHDHRLRNRTAPDVRVLGWRQIINRLSQDFLNGVRIAHSPAVMVI